MRLLVAAPHTPRMAIATALVGGAANAIGAVSGLAGAGFSKSSNEITAEVFKQQMRQSKRLWSADWAEASWRHGDQLMQAAQQHAEGQALAAAQYHQAERQFKQGFRQSSDMDARSFEMAWRSEVREVLRDELANILNRFNNVMLCDTVCLGCVFGMVIEGDPPPYVPSWLLMAYLFCMGLSISLFTVSLWCSVIIVRRLNEHTASVLERKLFYGSEDLRHRWKEQLENGRPTGVGIIQSLSKAYSEWVEENCEPMGNRAILMLSIGVVTMFLSAGLLSHAKYTYDFKV